MTRRRLDLAQPVLFLDYDGVLHPDHVYRVGGYIVLRGDGDLFEWAPVVQRLLEPHPQVQLVLSTSWVRVVGFDRARARLPASLQQRVVGATWHRQMDQHEWCALTRFSQVLRYVQRHRLARWLAVDNDGEGWPAEQAHRLVLTDAENGLGDPQVQASLTLRLAAIAGAKRVGD